VSVAELACLRVLRGDGVADGGLLREAVMLVRVLRGIDPFGGGGWCRWLSMGWRRGGDGSDGLIDGYVTGT
jgi:hypothetical protein